MKIWDFFSVTSKDFCSPVITLGVFDGMHRGHQKIISQVQNYALEMKGQSVVATFVEHPLKILKGDGPPLIMPYQKRLQILESMGIDVCLQIDFSSQIANIEAEEFVVKHLVERIGMRGIVTGRYFRFGNHGAGDRLLLERLSTQYNYKVMLVEISLSDGQPISSTNIRKYIMDGKIKEACNMLGRPFFIIGEVVHGCHRGRTMGFPTANIQVHHDLIPTDGVYYGYSIVDNESWPSLTSIGTCPTFGEHSEKKVEVHLLNFSGDLYGTRLETAILGKIRDQKKFPSKEALQEQMTCDRNYLINHLNRWIQERSGNKFMESQLHDFENLAEKVIK